MKSTSQLSLSATLYRDCASGSDLPTCRCALFLNPPPSRPDPATYSQIELWKADSALTFESPDVHFLAEPNYVNGAWQLPDPLTQSSVQVTVRNLSNDVSAVNAAVDLQVSTRPGI